MKKIFLMAAVLFSALFAEAQTEKGDQTLGFNLQFLRSTNKGTYNNPYYNTATSVDQTNTNFSIGPNYSFFVADKLDLGTTLFYNTNHTKNSDNYNPQKQINNTYGVNVYLRKYIMYQNKIGIRTGPYIGYSYNKAETTNNGSNAVYNVDGKTDNYLAGLNCELLFYPTRQLGVSLMIANLSYQHFKTDSGNQGNTRGDFFNLNFVNNGLGLSIFYTFLRK